MKNKFIKFLCICSLLFFSFGFVACQNNSGTSVYVGVCPETIEYGNYFYLPNLYKDGTELDKWDYDISFTKPNGETISDFNSEYPLGMIQLNNLGEYAIKYSYNGKDYNVNFTCIEDATAPVINTELSVAPKYFVGSFFNMDTISLYDPSELNEDVCGVYSFWTCPKFVTLAEMKQDINHETHLFDDVTKYRNVTSDYGIYEGEEKLLIKYESRYVVVIPAEDLKGNKTEYIYTFDTEKKYFDESLCETTDAYGLNFRYKDDNKVLMNFNHDGYTQYVDSPFGWGDSTDKISIKEIDGYKALCVTPNRRLSPHYILSVKFFESINVEDAPYIYIRYRVDQLTGSSTDGRIQYDNYPPLLFGVPYSYNNAVLSSFIYSDDTHITDSYQFSCADGVWNIARVPIKHFINRNETSIEGLKFCVSGEFYIDEIWFDSEIFNDVNRAENVLCDFDEEEYIFQIGKESIGDGANLRILSKIDLDNRSVDSSNVDGSVILIESVSTKYSSACIYIDLFDVVTATTEKKICFKFYYDGRMDGVEFSNLIFQRAGLSDYYDSSIYCQVVSENDGRYCGSWCTIEIDSTVFADENESFNKIALLSEGSLYIDSIWVK